MRGRSIYLKRKSFCWAIVLTAFFMQNTLQQMNNAFRYADEIAALLCLAYFLSEIWHQRIERIDIKIVIVIVLLCALGFLGNIKSEIQKSLKYQLFDAFNIFKYIMVIWGASYYFGKYQTKEYLLQYLSSIIRVIVWISTGLMVANLFADIGMHTDYRMGLRAYNFIFSRVGSLYSACVIWLIVLTASQYYKKRKANNIAIIFTLLNMCSTLRSRAFAFAVLFLICYYIFIIKGFRQLRMWQIVLTVVVLLYVGWEQLETYFSNDSKAARNILLKYGIETAKTYFPLGAGFGTYGTAVARDTYSVLYTQYGMNRYWGLDEDGGFLTDNYWPAVMGEFGFLGLLLTFLLIYLIMQKLIAITDNKFSKACVYFALGTLLISSIASSSFFACSQLMVFVCLICKMDFRRPNSLSDNKFEVKNENLDSKTVS